MRYLSALVICLLLTGCGEQPNGQVVVPDMPRFADEGLSKGRGIWMGTCRNCHLLGTSGAPAVTNWTAWQPRLNKGKPALYESALHGVKGADGQYHMPPRGGNPQLKDEQVRQAVDYMAASVEALHDG